MNQLSFYRAFEDRHRGDRSIIKERLKVYLGFILPLRALQEEFKALDLGCGRGEWLELLQDQGIDAVGIDLDQGMLSACEERGLNAKQGDAIATLRALKSGCMSLVTAFHVAEHLPFDDLLSLVGEAHRVLQSGGLLILETPNPENLVVAAHNFYVDPTHQRPLPPALLQFTTEYTGFERSRILRLQESEVLSLSDTPGFWDVVSGASPDYSVIAQKAGNLSLMTSIDGLFYADQGLKPETIASRYDNQIASRMDNIEQQLSEIETKLPKADNAFDKLENLTLKIFETLENQRDIERKYWASEAQLAEKNKALEDSEAQLAEKNKALEDSEAQLAEKNKALEDSEAQLAEKNKALEDSEAQLAEKNKALEEQIKYLRHELKTAKDQANEWHEQILRLKNSISWRITAPLRSIRALCIFSLRLLKRSTSVTIDLLQTLLLAVLGPLVILLSPLVLKNSPLRNKLGIYFSKYPKTKKLIQLLLRRRKNAEYTANDSITKEIDQSSSKNSKEIRFSSKRAEEIYKILEE